MGRFLAIHPLNPQQRLIDQAAAILAEGGILVYPTDTTYGLGCLISNRQGVERIIQIKRLPPTHQFSLLCADLAGISLLARVDNATYRILKRYLPGPYTFILPASREVPKSILPKRRTIGLRIPDHPICLALLRACGEPLLSTSLQLPGEEGIMSDPETIREVMVDRVDLVIDGGPLADQPSTMVDLTEGVPRVIRHGAGDPSDFLP
ncbi:MAG: threonylcarbamoyl-AMP synthase [Magnetococcales bacterium]|nr:threonylcarbamoyl-AMP synthase [Magnetococcales bacterium]MBF0155919.1 threonylcarbamoyl-AMP synthase [Magnetococcales bacterium]